MSKKFGVDLVAQDAAEWASSSVYQQVEGLTRFHPHWTPIEVLFFVAFFQQATRDGFHQIGWDNLRQVQMETAEETASRLGYCEIWVFPQCMIGRWRVDFAIAMGEETPRKPSWLLIECDGHDFHEKTKEQAAKDKARDRDLVSRGFQIFHFTGSELHRTPMKCANEVVAHLVKRSRA